jgi:hypothetical protein
MRHRLLILMVILLSLRGWVGEAMAGQMLAMEVAAAQATMQPAHEQVAMPDCHMALEAASPGDANDGMVCGSCLTCQACSLNALPVAAIPAAGRMVHALPPPVQARFASAQPVPGFKPPIS